MKIEENKEEYNPQHQTTGKFHSDKSQRETDASGSLRDDKDEELSNFPSKKVLKAANGLSNASTELLNDAQVELQNTPDIKVSDDPKQLNYAVLRDNDTTKKKLAGAPEKINENGTKMEKMKESTVVVNTSMPDKTSIPLSDATNEKLSDAPGKGKRKRYKLKCKNCTCENCPLKEYQKKKKEGKLEEVVGPVCKCEPKCACMDCEYIKRLRELLCNTVCGGAPKPETDTPKPETDTPKPETDTPEPGTDTPKPGTDTPVPGTDTPVPGTDIPVPGTDIPVPGTDTPVPGTDTPGTGNPEPGTDTPGTGTTPETPTRNCLPCCCPELIQKKRKCKCICAGQSGSYDSYPRETNMDNGESRKKLLLADNVQSVKEQSKNVRDDESKPKAGVKFDVQYVSVKLSSSNTALEDCCTLCSEEKKSSASKEEVGCPKKSEIEPKLPEVGCPKEREVSCPIEQVESCPTDSKCTEIGEEGNTMDAEGSKTVCKKCSCKVCPLKEYEKRKKEEDKDPLSVMKCDCSPECTCQNCGYIKCLRALLKKCDLIVKLNQKSESSSSKTQTLVAKECLKSSESAMEEKDEAKTKIEARLLQQVKSGSCFEEEVLKVTSTEYVSAQEAKPKVNDAESIYGTQEEKIDADPKQKITVAEPVHPPEKSMNIGPKVETKPKITDTGYVCPPEKRIDPCGKTDDKSSSPTKKITAEDLICKCGKICPCENCKTLKRLRLLLNKKTEPQVYCVVNTQISEDTPPKCECMGKCKGSKLKDAYSKILQIKRRKSSDTPVVQCVCEKSCACEKCQFNRQSQSNKETTVPKSSKCAPKKFKLSCNVTIDIKSPINAPQETNSPKKSKSPCCRSFKKKKTPCSTTQEYSTVPPSNIATVAPFNIAQEDIKVTTCCMTQEEIKSPCTIEEETIQARCTPEEEIKLPCTIPKDQEETKAPSEETKLPCTIPSEETKSPKEEIKLPSTILEDQEEAKVPPEETKLPSEGTKSPKKEIKLPSTIPEDQEETKAPPEETELSSTKLSPGTKSPKEEIKLPYTTPEDQEETKVPPQQEIKLPKRTRQEERMPKEKFEETKQTSLCTQFFNKTAGKSSKLICSCLNENCDCKQIKYSFKKLQCKCTDSSKDMKSSVKSLSKCNCLETCKCVQCKLKSKTSIQCDCVESCKCTNCRSNPLNRAQCNCIDPCKCLDCKFNPVLSELVKVETFDTKTVDSKSQKNRKRCKCIGTCSCQDKCTLCEVCNVESAGLKLELTCLKLETPNQVLKAEKATGKKSFLCNTQTCICTTGQCLAESCPTKKKSDEKPKTGCKCTSGECKLDSCPTKNKSKEKPECKCFCSGSMTDSSQTKSKEIDCKCIGVCKCDPCCKLCDKIEATEKKQCKCIGDCKCTCCKYKPREENKNLCNISKCTCICGECLKNCCRSKLILEPGKVKLPENVKQCNIKKCTCICGECLKDCCPAKRSTPPKEIECKCIGVCKCDPCCKLCDKIVEKEKRQCKCIDVCKCICCFFKPLEEKLKDDGKKCNTTICTCKCGECLKYCCPTNTTEVKPSTKPVEPVKPIKEEITPTEPTEPPEIGSADKPSTKPAEPEPEVKPIKEEITPTEPTEPPETGSAVKPSTKPAEPEPEVKPIKEEITPTEPTETGSAVKTPTKPSEPESEVKPIKEEITPTKPPVEVEESTCSCCSTKTTEVKPQTEEKTCCCCNCKQNSEPVVKPPTDKLPVKTCKCTNFECLPTDFITEETECSCECDETTTESGPEDDRKIVNVQIVECKLKNFNDSCKCTNFECLSTDFKLKYPINDEKRQKPTTTECGPEVKLTRSCCNCKQNSEPAVKLPVDLPLKTCKCTDFECLPTSFKLKYPLKEKRGCCCWMKKPEPEVKPIKEETTPAGPSESTLDTKEKKKSCCCCKKKILKCLCKEKPRPSETTKPGSEVESPGSEVKPPGPEVKPPGPEVKPPEPEVKPPGSEVKPPGPEVKEPTPEVKVPDEMKLCNITECKCICNECLKERCPTKINLVQLKETDPSKTTEPEIKVNPPGTEPSQTTEPGSEVKGELKQCNIPECKCICYECLKESCPTKATKPTPEVKASGTNFGIGQDLTLMYLDLIHVDTHEPSKATESEVENKVTDELKQCNITEYNCKRNECLKERCPNKTTESTPEEKPPGSEVKDNETAQENKKDSAKEKEEDSSKKEEKDSAKEKAEDSIKEKEEDSAKEKEGNSTKEKKGDSAKDKEEDSTKEKEEDSAKEKEDNSIKEKEEDSTKEKEEDSTKKKEEDSVKEKNKCICNEKKGDPDKKTARAKREINCKCTNFECLPEDFKCKYTTKDKNDLAKPKPIKESAKKCICTSVKKRQLEKKKKICKCKEFECLPEDFKRKFPINNEKEPDKPEIKEPPVCDCASKKNIDSGAKDKTEKKCKCKKYECLPEDVKEKIRQKYKVCTKNPNDIEPSKVCKCNDLECLPEVKSEKSIAECKCSKGECLSEDCPSNKKSPPELELKEIEQNLDITPAITLKPSEKPSEEIVSQKGTKKQPEVIEKTGIPKLSKVESSPKPEASTQLDDETETTAQVETTKNAGPCSGPKCKCESCKDTESSDSKSDYRE